MADGGFRLVGHGAEQVDLIGFPLARLVGLGEDNQAHRLLLFFVDQGHSQHRLGAGLLQVRGQAGVEDGTVLRVELALPDQLQHLDHGRAGRLRHTGSAELHRRGGRGAGAAQGAQGAAGVEVLA